jgi:hypothetical protein
MNAFVGRVTLRTGRKNALLARAYQARSANNNRTAAAPIGNQNLQKSIARREGSSNNCAWQASHSGSAAPRSLCGFINDDS